MPKINSDYLQGINGTIMDIPLPGTLHIACCSCGLDHLYIFEPLGKKQLRMTVYRDDHMTEAHRKKGKFECVPRTAITRTKGKVNAR